MVTSDSATVFRPGSDLDRPLTLLTGFVPRIQP
jgi:hypothetical protein